MRTFRRLAIAAVVVGLLVEGGSAAALADVAEPSGSGSVTVVTSPSTAAPTVAVSLRCVLSGEELSFDGTVSGEGPVTFDGLPTGAECTPTAAPTSPADDIVGAGFRWAVPRWRDVDAARAVDLASFTVTADAERNLSVDVPALGQFEVSVTQGAGRDVGFTCDAPAYGEDGRAIADEDSSGTLDVAAGEAVSSDWYRVGTACRLIDEGSAREEIVTIGGAASPIAVAFGASEADVAPNPDPDPAPSAPRPPRPLAASSGFVIVDRTSGSDSGYSGPITYEYTCTGVAGAPSGSVDLAPGETSEVIDAPVRSRCESRAAAYPPAPDGWRIVDLSYGASYIGRDAEPAELRSRLLLVSTTLTAPVALTPRLIDPGSGFDGRIRMDWECWGGASGSTIARLNEPSAPVDMPVGDICNVSSTDLVDPAPPGWELALENLTLMTGMPTVIPLSAVGTGLSVDVTDEMVAMSTDLVVEVVVVNPDGVAHTAPFTGTWTCDFFGTISEGTWELGASGGRVYRDVMSHSDCSITQDALVDPSGGEWADPVVELVPDPRGSGVPAFVVTNTLRATSAPAGTGSLPATGGTFEAGLWALGGGVTLVLGAAFVGGARRRSQRR
jgi:hypothetical protein